MNKEFQNIIFDFDGTLADTSPVIISTMKATIKELGLPEKTDAECRATIGLRLEDIPETLWPELHGIGQQYASTYRLIFDEQKEIVPAQPYPGVIKGLKTLHDAEYKLAVASSRSHKSLEEYLDFFGIAYMFSDIIGGGDVEKGKPSPDPVLAVCHHTGWLPKNCLVVGDAVYDIMMGKTAGCKTYGVSYGNQTREELLTADPTGIADSFDQLIDMIMLL